MNIVLPQKLFHDIFAEVHYVLEVLEYFFRGLQHRSTEGLTDAGPRQTPPDPLELLSSQLSGPPLPSTQGPT